MLEIMKNSMLRGGVAMLLALAVAGCASTPNPFVHLRPDYSELPVAELDAVAQEIEAAVDRGDREYAPPTRGGIVADTPEIKQAVKQRAARHELVTALLAAGYAEETDSGLVNMITNSAYKKATTKRERDRNALVVYSENQNRWTLYEGIMKASNLPPRSLSAIQETFYKARTQGN